MAEGISLMRVHRHQRHFERPLFSPLHLPSMMFADFRDVVIAAPAQARRKQNAGAKSRIAIQGELDQMRWVNTKRGWVGTIVVAGTPALNAIRSLSRWYQKTGLANKRPPADRQFGHLA
jgi:hypothetical protein